MKKEEMKEVARDVFERIDGVEKVFVTSDGQAFVDEHYAKSHTLHNREGKELSMETFLKSEVCGSGTDEGKPGKGNSGKNNKPEK
jgi:hypothetical protein|nr:MAG TPA: NifU-like protein [Caudoviricetes sp.]